MTAIEEQELVEVTSGSETENKKETQTTSRQWTIEQETTLYKAICRYKPAGQHKHFRMICIYQMVNNPNITPPESMLSMKDIWSKLALLYDLDGLDELEDSSSFMAEEERLAKKEQNEKKKSVVPLHWTLGGKLGDGTYLQEFSLPWDADIEKYILEHAKSSEKSEDEDESTTITMLSDSGTSLSENNDELSELEDEEGEEEEGEEEEEEESQDEETEENEKREKSEPSATTTTTTPKKRGRSQSVESQNQTSDLSDEGKYIYIFLSSSLLFDCSLVINSLFI